MDIESGIHGQNSTADPGSIDQGFHAWGCNSKPAVDFWSHRLTGFFYALAVARNDHGQLKPGH